MASRKRVTDRQADAALAKALAAVQMLTAALEEVRRVADTGYTDRKAEWVDARDFISTWKVIREDAAGWSWAAGQMFSTLRYCVEMDIVIAAAELVARVEALEEGGVTV